MKNLNLRSIMVLNKDTNKTLGKKIGKSEVSISKKINGKVDWTLKEIKDIQKIYNLSNEEIDRIFLE